jgi:hypothetical protein
MQSKSESDHSSPPNARAKNARKFDDVMMVEYRSNLAFAFILHNHTKFQSVKGYSVVRIVTPGSKYVSVGFPRGVGADIKTDGRDCSFGGFTLLPH